MISRSCYRPGTIISQSAGIPCTDPGYRFPVCLMFTASLDIPLSPTGAGFCFPRYLSLHLQMLEHDHALHTIAPCSLLPSSVFRRFVYAHLPCVCAEPCSLWNLRIRPNGQYIRSFHWDNLQIFFPRTVPSVHDEVPNCIGSDP